MAEFELRPSAETRKTVSELRKEMSILRDVQAKTIQGSEDWTKASARIGEIKNQLADASEQAKIFAASTTFEKSQNAIETLKKGIFTLDFGKAQQGAVALQNVVNNFKVEEISNQIKDLSATFVTLGTTGVTAVSKLTESFSALLPSTQANLKTLTSFKGLNATFKTLSSGVVTGFRAMTSVVKTFGAAALKIGLQLLTNPIFLLATAITLIVVALVALLNKLGVFKIIMEALQVPLNIIKAAVDAIIQSFKNLTDWLGITKFAAREAADSKAASSKKAADAIEKENERIITALDNEIRKIQASGDESDEAFETILANEKEKRIQLEETAKARLAEAQAALAAAQIKKKVDAKEIEDLTEKLELAEKIAKQSTVEIEIGEIAAETARKKRRDKAAQDEENDAKKAAEKRKKQREDEEKARLVALQRVEDIKNSLIEDSTQRELAVLQTKFNREREEVLKNTLLTAKLRKELEDQLRIQFESDQQKILDAKKKSDDDEAKEERNNAFKRQQNVDAALLEARKLGAKILDDDEKLRAAERISRSREREAELVAIEKVAQREKLENLENALQREEITLEEYNALLALETLRSQQTITAIEETEAKKRIEISREEQEMKLKETLKMYEGFIESLAIIRDQGNQLGVDLAGNALFAIKQFTEIANTEFENATQKALAYAQVISNTIFGILEAISESQRTRSEEELRILKKSSDDEAAELKRRYEEGLITKQQYDESINKSNLSAEAKALAIKKKAFESDKKLKIGQAITSGLSGAVAAFSSAMPLLPPQNVIVGSLLAGLVSSLAALNVAKISSTQFEGGTSSTPSLPSAPQAAVPQFQGEGNRANVATATRGAEIVQNLSVTAVVSETEVTSTQQRIAKMNANSEL